MKTLIATAITALALCSASAHASSMKKVPLVENGITNSTLIMPASTRCEGPRSDGATILECKSSKKKYFMLGFMPKEAIEPQEFGEMFIKEIVEEQDPTGEVLDRYLLEEISQAHIRADAPLHWKQGQQITTLAFDHKSAKHNSLSAAALVLQYIPSLVGGPPNMYAVVFGVETSKNSGIDQAELRRELVRWASSIQHTSEGVMASNQIHQKTLAGLNDLQRSHESNMAAKRRIAQAGHQRHLDNMAALDQSHNRYMENSHNQHQQYRDSVADLRDTTGHEAYVNSIHEREVLTNPHTGQQYEADGYYDYNYVNPNDQDIYVRTNDPNFNPNVNTEIGADYQLLER